MVWGAAQASPDPARTRAECAVRDGDRLSIPIWRAGSRELCAAYGLAATADAPAPGNVQARLALDLRRRTVSAASGGPRAAIRCFSGLDCVRAEAGHFPDLTVGRPANPGADPDLPGMTKLVRVSVPFLLLATAAAQTWTNVANAVHPSARYASAMVFDQARQQFVLFGGHDGQNRTNDTWLLSAGNTWTLANPAVRPPARRWHAMAYDSHRQVTVLYGGDGVAGSLADLWEFDGTAWTDHTQSWGPGPCANHVMTYDPVQHRTLLIGAALSAGYYRTWLWNGSSWAATSSNTWNRSFATMVFDESRGVAVLFGGMDQNGVPSNQLFECNNNNWTPRPVPASLAPRYGHAMAYDPLRQHIVLAGGRNTAALGDVWEYMNGTFYLRAATLPNHYASAMAYGLGHTMLFGGGTFPGVLADTERYDVLAPVYETWAPGCDPADLHAVPGSLAYAGTTLVREVTGVPPGFPLILITGLTATPTAMAAYGMPGCTLVPHADVARFLFPTSTSMTMPLLIPNHAALAGQVFYDQIAIVAPAANALGLTLSNAVHGIIQRP
jgi:hypothetical protein